ncbi:NAD(P)H-hydrate dehydratase [Bizionia sediminis]|uniref:Bifunctional NAD(P)H-hydrate repair enzyme n=1 Tax=Bizionia sediminis TaxID=1737064 RepID=A0ABW5KRZ7_9FLAO
MKIFSDEQVYEGDKFTAQKQQITSIELMERAGIQIFNWLHLRMQGAQVPIHVFCGIGNNGGNGLVVARHLVNHGYNVHTYVVNFSDKRTKGFLVNYDLMKQTQKKWPTLIGPKDDFPKIGPDDIILDAVFGVGLNRPADDWVVHLFQHFKASKAFVLSVDIPSGLKTNAAPVKDTDVVWANHTLSFQSPKLVFFLEDTAKFTAQWEVLDVGIDPEYLQKTNTLTTLITKQDILPVYKPRKPFSHKGTYGHALLIGGSYGKIGAVQLASRATLVSGAGLVTAFVPKCGYLPLQSSVPELMLITDTNDTCISNIAIPIEPTVIGIGVGMGTSEETASAFTDFLNQNTKPLVIDADGLNLLAKTPALMEKLPKYSVLTPHAKELERLIGKWSNDFDKLDKAINLSEKYNIILVLKGRFTLIVYKKNLYINATGNPGLATGGTGDVLTGIITGLMAQQYEPLEAAIFGVYLHGKSADIAVQDFGYEAMTASRVISYLPKAFLDLFVKPEPPKTANKQDDKTTKK